MDVLGQIGDTIFVADQDREVLFAVAADPDTPRVKVVDGTTPDRWLKFTGGYLVDTGRPDDEIIDQVEAFLDPTRPLPLVGTGATAPAGPRWVVGELADGTRILSGAEQVEADTEVWLEPDPATVLTMDALDAARSAVWDETPTPLS